MDYETYNIDADIQQTLNGKLTGNFKKDFAKLIEKISIERSNNFNRYERWLNRLWSALAWNENEPYIRQHKMTFMQMKDIVDAWAPNKDEEVF